MKTKFLKLILLVFLTLSGCNTINNSSYDESEKLPIEDVIEYTPSYSIAEQEGYIDTSVENVNETKDSDNIVNHNFETNTTNFNYFSTSSVTYDSMSKTQSKKDKNKAARANEIKEETLNGIIDDTSIAPYSSIGTLVATYKNVYYKDSLHFATYYMYGTCFLINNNTVLTNALYIFNDVNSTVILNKFRFPDSVDFYFGHNGDQDINLGSKYKWYAKGIFTSFNKESYLNKDTKNTWAMIRLDRNIGESHQTFSIEKDWYSKNVVVNTFGYISGSKYQNKMYKMTGTVLKENSKSFFTENFGPFDLNGSPCFIEENGEQKVCGMLLYSDSQFATVLKITDFIISLSNS